MFSVKYLKTCQHFNQEDKSTFKGKHSYQIIVHCLHTELAGMMLIILVLVITIPVTQPHLEKLLFCISLTEDKDSSLTRNVDGLATLSCFSSYPLGSLLFLW